MAVLVVVAVLGAALVLTLFVCQPVAVFRVLEWIAPSIVWRGRTSEPLVALSFDDGPSPEYTPRVLDMLARHGTRATFFLIGARAAAYPDVVARIRAAGHEIGNHYVADVSVLAQSTSEFLENVRRTEGLLGLNGERKLFRPPGGLIRPAQLRALRSQGYVCVLGSAYPFDPHGPPAGYIRWLVTKNLAPGAIVVLHDGIADASRMLAALDAILAAGQARGLRFGTVGELLFRGP